ncbi:MAG: DeoR family transcriptional regulator [Thalassobium sp.]|nr:MAG: DeoR family transcriptional regulator [Thalassobium sp.]
MDQTNITRHAAILAQARTQGKVSATALASQLDVTVQTIRRDLRALAALGAVERVHGGAVLASGVGNIGYGDRRALHREAKARIAAVTARLIPHRASLFLNIGTTTESVAHALRHHSDLMVVTNNLNVANILAQNPRCDVVVAGGQLRRADGGLVGDLATLAIERFKVDYAIIGASAIDGEGDLLDFDAQEVHVSRAILAQARQSIVVADASKFSRKAPMRIGSLMQADDLVTDAVPSERLVSACADWGTRITLA